MDKEYWQWKNTIIDFNAISDEKIDCNNFITKKDYVFSYLGTPDNETHEWYNGGFSSEYNKALKYAKQLGLVENVIDYEDKIYKLEQQVKKQKEVIDKAKNKLDTIIHDIEEFDEAPVPSVEELCEIFNTLNEVSK